MCHRAKRIALFVALIATWTGFVQAEFFFRGMPLYQQGNEYPSPVLGRALPFGIDVHDEFNRSGPIGNSTVDSFRIGFVPPVQDVPWGPLTGWAAEVHGRWVPDVNADYIADNGQMRRATGNGVSTIALPWRVFPTLGDNYLIKMTADVAPGEEVRLAYTGDASVYGTAQGFDGPLGQLVYSLQRGSDADNDPTTGSQDLFWSISWDVEGNRQFVSGSATAAVGDELLLQLGWLDENRPGMSDRFDAWLGTPNGNHRLSAGNMNVGNLRPIDVFGIGVEIRGISSDGTLSSIGSFTGAVPEPALATTTFLGLATFTAYRFRRKRRR